MQLTEGIESYPNIVHKLKKFDHQATAIHPYDALLLELERVLPVIDNRFYMDEGKLSTTRANLRSESLYVLKDYELIIYDITSGKRYIHELSIFE